MLDMRSSKRLKSMQYRNYRQLKAIEEKNKKKFLDVNPDLNNKSGIYFLTRRDENDIPFFYIGQSVGILNRLASHMTGYQHIDLSLKSHGLYSKDNPHGWKVGFINYPQEKLNEMEQYWILEYLKNGYQSLNKTTGSQGEGKKKLAEYKPAKTYRDGLAQGYKNAARDIAHLFDLHLDVVTKKNPPTVNQQKALDKFKEFLNIYKEGKGDEQSGMDKTT